MSKAKHDEPEAQTVVLAPHDPAETKGPLLPLPLKILFALVLGVGILVGVSRHARTVSAMFDAMENCDASVLDEKNGLDDRYGVVKFNNKQGDIAQYLSLCDTDPALAREVFRAALDSRHKSSQIIALYSSFFLAGSKQLEKEDWDRMVKALDPNNAPDSNNKEKYADVRKAAQRALGDLIFITDTANVSTYQAIPAAAKESPDGSNRIQTHEEKLQGSGKTGLNIRWSNADLAFVWLQEMASKGQWDNALQRFVIGK